jgi:flavin-dependent dehydrogenase
MSAEHPEYDVVVVGARVAGASSALLLARAGLRVLVVDRSRYGADTLSTHAVMRAGVMQLHRWGVLPAVVAAGTPAVRSTTFRFANDSITIPIKPAHGVDALYAPKRTVLDPLLVNAAIEAGADVRFGVSVTGLHRAGHGRVDGIEARDATGRPFTVRARLVIGADGIRSTVASHAGARIVREGRHAAGVVYGYWSGVEADGYEWMFRPNACAGIIPTNDGQVCVFALASQEKIGRGGHAVLRRILAEASPEAAARVGAGVAPEGVRSFAGRAGFLRAPWGPGWALVGDAGYWKDPVSAHGITDALRDAELLARATVAMFSGHASEAEAMTDFATTRDRLSLPLFDVVDTVASQAWSADEIGGLLLQLSTSMNEEVEVLASLDAAPVA